MATINSGEVMLAGKLAGLDSFNTAKNLAYMSLLEKKYKMETQDIMANTEKIIAIAALILIQSFKVALQGLFFKMPLYKKTALAKI